ncbi:hypothetical protein PIB30_006358 [Stylosanthes scabra]|uniref:Uncharacterized protein n=1 Tax=Stylosanthes scabra TaxID=79078 RepID=A0ABU6S4S5_9FABA|nr:hypothetical protein [Stylosanthes scabra]
MKFGLRIKIFVESKSLLWGRASLLFLFRGPFGPNRISPTQTKVRIGLSTLPAAERVECGAGLVAVTDTHTRYPDLTTLESRSPLSVTRRQSPPRTLASRVLAATTSSLIEPSPSLSVEAIASRPYPLHRPSPLGFTSRNLTSFRRSIAGFRRNLASFRLSHTPPSQPRLSPSRPRLNTQLSHIFVAVQPLCREFIFKWKATAWIWWHKMCLHNNKLMVLLFGI